MALIAAYYGKGKSDAKEMAKAWHVILKDTDYKVAERAVIHYAKYDDREYAVFPSVGQIVMAIQQEKKLPRLIHNTAVAGEFYRNLKPIAKDLISEDNYEKIRKMEYEDALKYIDSPVKIERRELHG